MKPTLRRRFWFWLERFGFFNRVLFKYDGIAPSGFDRYVHKMTGHVELLDDDFKVVKLRRYRDNI